MELIIGGAYQGKRAYAKEALGVSDGDFFTCSGTTLDTSRRCIEHLERYTLACVQAGLDSVEVTDLDTLADKIVICDDISCGVVPIDPMERAWREQTGRLLTKLSGRASRVTRIFCGLPLELKG